MSSLKTADLFGLDDREKSKESQNIYDVALAGGERKPCGQQRNERLTIKSQAQNGEEC